MIWLFGKYLSGNTLTIKGCSLPSRMVTPFCRRGYTLSVGWLHPDHGLFLPDLQSVIGKREYCFVTKLYRVFIIGHPLSFFSLETQCFPFLAQGLNIEA